MKKGAGAALAVVLVALFGAMPAISLVLAIIGMLVMEDADSQSNGVMCAQEAPRTDLPIPQPTLPGAVVPGGPVSPALPVLPAVPPVAPNVPAPIFRAGTYSGDQMLNAKIIIDVGALRGISVHGQTVAVMTAIGESSLKNIAYGDSIHGVKNPDGSATSSIGLFQQQVWYEPKDPLGPEDPGYGLLNARMDPKYAAGKFYDDLVGVPGWETLEPTMAAHKAQRNKDPNHYTKYWEDAVMIVESLAGQGVFDAAGMIVGQGCLKTVDDLVAPVATGGWALPAQGRISSGFGPRNTGISGASTMHRGTDIANVCGTPMFAAASGTVISAGSTSGTGGNTIKIDHGGGVLSLYLHVFSGSFLVAAGDAVTAGQQIAEIGGDRVIDPVGSGSSSGCHLHFEVRVNAAATDPVPFMAERGITLGTT